ncbi:MAG: hypothetical protein IT495_02890 [Gammaproteobacteria bacterium]|nr:hypothetical protein [Gammaproteobacteria bacterium]
MSAPGTVAAAMEHVPFPSLEWFRHLAALMNANRARQEQLGYVDCVADFTVTDGAADGGPFTVLVTFEEFEATDVRATSAAGAGDFSLQADLATWRAMIESIAAGGGRPGLEFSLNRLSHMGTPMRVVADDPLRMDLYFRYNQSLQEFVNASAHFVTDFR